MWSLATCKLKAVWVTDMKQMTGEVNPTHLNSQEPLSCLCRTSFLPQAHALADLDPPSIATLVEVVAAVPTPALWRQP